MFTQGRVPRILQSVITVLFEGPEDARQPVGTGFFLTYDSKYQFLITARHLVFDKDGARSRTWVRVNRKDQGTELIWIGDDRVFVPEDPTVDLAVLPGGYDGLPIAPKSLEAQGFVATRDDLKPPAFEVGAEVLYMGSFNPHVGDTRNQPITRFGRVALIPDEPIYWSDGYIDVILAEVTAFGGSSGSPVFVYLGNTDERGLPVPKILGVLKGSFTQDHPAKLVDIDARLLVTNVVGIAAIVPAFLLDDLIRQVVIPELESEAAG